MLEGISMTNTELKEKLEQMQNLDIVELLLSKQSEVLDLYNKREMNKNDPEKWEFYHSKYYEVMMELISIKFYCTKKMNYGDTYYHKTIEVDL